MQVDGEMALCHFNASTRLLLQFFAGLAILTTLLSIFQSILELGFLLQFEPPKNFVLSMNSGNPFEFFTIFQNLPSTYNGT